MYAGPDAYRNNSLRVNTVVENTKLTFLFRSGHVPVDPWQIFLSACALFMEFFFVEEPVVTCLMVRPEGTLFFPSVKTCEQKIMFPIWMNQRSRGPYCSAGANHLPWIKWLLLLKVPTRSSAFLMNSWAQNSTGHGTDLLTEVYLGWVCVSMCCVSVFQCRL